MCCFGEFFQICFGTQVFVQSVCVCVCVQLVESGIMLRHRCTLINPHELQALIRQEEHATALEQHLSKFRDAYERQHQVLYEGSMELDDAKEPDPIPISSKAQELVASFDCLNALDQPAKDVLIKQIVETNPWEVEGSHSQLRDDDVSFRWLQLGCKLPPLTKRSEPISPLTLPPTPNQSRVLPTPSETTPNSPCSGSEEKHVKKCCKRPRRKGGKYGKYRTQKVIAEKKSIPI